MDGDNSGAVCLREPYNNWRLFSISLGAYLTKVRNFRPGYGSVWEEEERAVRSGPFLKI